MIESKKLNLPELKGSEKQVVWATSIRINFFKLIDDYMDVTISEYKETKPTADQIAAVKKEIEYVFYHEKEAKF